MKRKLLITGIGVKVKLHFETDPKTLKKVKQQFKGMIQLDIESSGDFSEVTDKALESLILNYFVSNPTITLHDFIRLIN